MKLLIIEDEAELRRSLVGFFTREGHVVESAGTFREGEDRIALHSYDCIILDLTLPGGNGVELLKQVRQKGDRTGVVVLSARDGVEDKVGTLTHGADDHLAKPFHLVELNARVAAVLRRMQQAPADVVEYGNLSYAIDRKVFSVQGTELALSRKELDLLAFFMANRDRVLSKGALMEHVWGDDADTGDNYDILYAQIKNLRRKLADAGAGPTIQAVYGLGYRLHDEPLTKRP
jgi:DNA-binding response OmpR family regulator